MDCPKCGNVIERRSELGLPMADGTDKECVLCGKAQSQCNKMFVGVGGGVCVDCVLLCMEMINNPDKYGAEDVSGTP